MAGQIVELWSLLACTLKQTHWVDVGGKKWGQCPGQGERTAGAYQLLDLDCPAAPACLLVRPAHLEQSGYKWGQWPGQGERTAGAWNIGGNVSSKITFTEIVHLSAAGPGLYWVRTAEAHQLWLALILRLAIPNLHHYSNRVSKSSAASCSNRPEVPVSLPAQAITDHHP